MPEGTIVQNPTASETKPEVIIQPKSFVEALAEHLPELQEDADAIAKAREAKPEAETNPPAGGEDDGKGEGGGEPESKPEAKAPADRDKMQERIDRLTRELNDERRAREEAEAKARGEKKPEPSKSSEKPAGILDGALTPEDVQAKVQAAQTALRLAKRYFRDGDPFFVEDAKAEGGKRELTKEEVSHYEDMAEEILRSAPERMAFLQNRAARDAESRELLPEFFTDGSDEAKALEGMSQIAAFDGFEDATNARIAMVIGFQEIARRRAAKADKKESGTPAEQPLRKSPEAKPPAAQKKQEIAPPVPGPSGTPHVDGKDLALQKAEKEWEESNGDEAALQRYLEAKARAGK